MRRALSLLVLLAVAGVASAAAPAGPASQLATVTAVASGDTLEARLVSGKVMRVHIAGVRTPATGTCHADEAAAETRRLALGKRVTLVREGAGFYVALREGADLGRTLVSAGLAQVDGSGPPFSRFPSYVPAQQRAEKGNVGMWASCAADVAVAIAAAPSPVVVGGRLTYTVTVSNRGPLAAPQVALEVRPPEGVELVSGESPDGSCAARDWVGTCTFASVPADGTATATFVGEVRRAGTLATRAAVRLTGCVFRACGAAPLHDADLRNDETAVLSAAVDTTSPPPPPPSGPGSPPPAPAPSGACHPSYPGVCIPPPPPDLDCADIPYRDFAAPLDVRDPDPHDLDGDEDGIGCQFNDY